MTKKGRKLLVITAASCLLLLAMASGASAEISFEGSFGGLGAAGGKFSTPAGIAANTATNDVYVVDRGQNRIEQFSADGGFLRAWGYDVVESGPDDRPAADEVDEVRIRATSGSFRLDYEGASTSPIAFDAGPAQVQSALNGLPTISAEGGSVSVTGGPGDPTGANPYVVTFDGGPLAGRDVQLHLEPAGLGIPNGATMSCVGGSHETEFTLGDATYEFQWLANGVPVAGATERNFAPGAAEAGKAIQCRVTAVIESVKVVTTSRPYFIVSPAPAPLPPLGPEILAAPTGHAELGAPGGEKLKCGAGSWEPEATSYTFQWYRNGVPIGQPRTSAATEDEYTLTQSDLESRAVFQCAVTGINAGGASTVFSAVLESDPAPEIVREATAEASISPLSRSTLYARANGGAVFEICEGADICKEGVSGPGVGQLSTPRGIAVDNSPGGEHDVYVVDDENARVQKFTSAGQPVLSIGKEVDQTSQEDVCVVATGDVCGPGIRAGQGEGLEDLSPSAFGTWPTEFAFRELGNELAVDPAGNLYVGDAREGRNARLQKFDSSGHFLSQARTRVSLGLRPPISIAVDSQERAYSTIESEFGGVLRTLPSEFSADGKDTQYVGNLFDTNRNARHVAVDPRNDRILVSDINNSDRASVCGGPTTKNRAILEYDPAQNEIDCSAPKGGAALKEVTGMTVSGDGHLYVSVGSENVVKKFSLPTSEPPTIGAETASDITTNTARIHGEVNPGFEDTTYTIEFGTSPCSTGGCQTVEGGLTRGLKTIDGSASIDGLDPGTTYYYRLTAENRLGTDAGEDKTFTTFQQPDLTDDQCPNALARKQTKTAGLLDCRAYELASAGSTGGYDVVSDLVPGQQPFDFYPGASDKLLYGVKDGGIPGTDNPTNRGIDPYVATRGEDGWSTRYVGIPANNPFAATPFSSTLIGADSALETFAFGGPGVCDPCFEDGSSGIPVRLPDDRLTQGMAGEFEHPGAQSDGYVAERLSADGAHLIFGSTAQFAAGGNDETGDVSIYDRNLRTGMTHVISNSPTGTPLVCLQGAGQCHSPGDQNGIAELAISSDGSRVLLAQKVGSDAKDNVLWHLYLAVDDSTSTIDLTPTTTTGVYFDGMTAAGDRVFFSTVDQLLGDDEDESADVYEAGIDSGSSALRLISTNSDGSPSNSDACNPPGTPNSWNSASSEGKCSALAFAGGAGVAAESGSFFFVTPEQLEAGEGIVDQANLYEVAPGGHPSFVATIDSSTIKPGPPPARRPLVNGAFAAPFEEIFTGSMTVDQANGDLYLIAPQEGAVFRFDSSGAPANFTAGPGAGSNTFSVPVNSAHPGAAQVAVDSSPSSAGSPLAGALYVATANAFLQPEATVAIYAPSGEQIGALNGSTTAAGKFGEPCGVAVDQSTGTVYVADREGLLYQYQPSSPSGTIDDGDYTVEEISTSVGTPCALALDGAGHLYVASSPPGEFQFSVPGGPVFQIDVSEFASGSSQPVKGTEVAEVGTSLVADPITNELYVNESSRVTIYDATGTKLTSYGETEMAPEGGCGFLKSRGIALNFTTHHSYIPCVREFPFSQIKEYGYEPRPFTPIDNPGIVHAVQQHGSHDFADFQVTPDGAYAAFPSAMPIKSDYDNSAKLEIYRYRGADGALVCVSCNPTGSPAQRDSALPSHGTGLLEDGRVFFDSDEALTLSDTNGRQDAYEWSPERHTVGGCKDPNGCQQLISTGNSSSPAGLLGASADGRDAFFFTRDTLVQEDRNGNAMKIYDAREGGGFFLIPPPPPCAASDECHGASSQAPVPATIGTLKGSGGQIGDEKPRKPRCKKGFVRRKRHCVKKRHHHKRHKRQANRREGRR